jgi:adenosylcobinamide-GDP ribazoletransferase
MNEIKVFFAALLFYTRIPCPAWVTHSDNNLNKATRYLPVIGWIVGAFCALVLFLAVLILQPDVAIGLSMAAGVLLTGAFHEDGFADVCDGFGGGWTKQKILEIMKDSRIGAYGAIGIFFLLLLKFAAIKQLSPDIRFTALICAHTLSRLSAVLVIRFNTYARETDDAKAKFVAAKISNTDFLWALLFGLLPLFLLNNLYAISILLPLFFVQYFMSKYFKKWIGGYTGDCLGAIQQVCELVCYISIYMLHSCCKNNGILESLIY